MSAALGAGMTARAAQGVPGEAVRGNCLHARPQVLLDVASISPDRILLLDSYFYVVVFHGTSIAQWRKEGYHLQPEHAGFKQLLEVGGFSG